MSLFAHLKYWVHMKGLKGACFSPNFDIDAKNME